MALRKLQPEERYDPEEIFENNLDGYIEAITLAFQLREYACQHLKKDYHAREKIIEFYLSHNPRRDLEKRLAALQQAGESRDSDSRFEELYLLSVNIPAELYALLARRYHLHPMEEED